MRTSSSQEDITLLAGRILESLRLAAPPGARTSASAGSIGIAFDEPGITSEKLLRNADIAMYKAKEGGKDRFEVYRKEMHAAVLARIEQERELRAAILDADLLTHYQPIYDLAHAPDHRLRGAGPVGPSRSAAWSTRACSSRWPRSWDSSAKSTPSSSARPACRRASGRSRDSGTTVWS